MKTISSSKGILRPWQTEDIPALAVLANNAAIAANLRDGFPHPYAEEDAARFITNVASLPVDLCLGGDAATRRRAPLRGLEGRSVDRELGPQHPPEHDPGMQTIRPD
jgi:hypothetical protein